MTSVLIVHGRPADRELLVTVLGNAGYAVAEAATGELALAFARSQRPDLIITHILMPDMDGYELVNKLRSEPVTADIRVIFYTATYLVEEVRQLAAACGVSQILVKPCEPEEIICAVSKALSSPQVARVALTSKEFHREHLWVLNTKLGQKIDELHDVERQATESLTLLEAIQSSAPVGFGFVDREYRLRRVNDVLAAFAGARVEQLLGREVGDVVPELWAQLEPAYERVLATGEAVVNQQVQRETSSAPGEIRSWLTNYYPVWIEGEISGIGLVVVDITDRLAAEEFRSLPDSGAGHDQTAVKLTPRQQETLLLLANGLGTYAIASHLVISVHTARNHIRAVLSSLDAHTRLEAVAIARRIGVLSL